MWGYGEVHSQRAIPEDTVEDVPARICLQCKGSGCTHCYFLGLELSPKESQEMYDQVMAEEEQYYEEL